MGYKVKDQRPNFKHIVVKFREPAPGKDGRVTIFDHAQANTTSTSTSNSVIFTADGITAKQPS